MFRARHIATQQAGKLKSKIHIHTIIYKLNLTIFTLYFLSYFIYYLVGTA